MCVYVFVKRRNNEGGRVNSKNDKTHALPLYIYDSTDTMIAHILLILPTTFMHYVL